MIRLLGRFVRRLAGSLVGKSIGKLLVRIIKRLVGRLVVHGLRRLFLFILVKGTVFIGKFRQTYNGFGVPFRRLGPRPIPYILRFMNY